nr:hypothetical protein [Tanacetum cinerariifolium]
MAGRGQNHRKRKNKQAYPSKPKIPSPPKREDPAKDLICHECGETGHWKMNCPQYLAELLKKKKNATSRAGGLGIFVIVLNTILNRSWIYDTGCGIHICNTTQGLRTSRKLKLGALSLYVGNGQREAVEAISVFYLCLSSGLEIVLNNCHYAPSITRGVISVSRLYEDSFINRFVNNTIQVSRNNMVYFSAIPRDDLDSALMWHCRLGHISKKRIEKLQHDGILDSTDLRAFEKCVSCMSGKMARKPYTYHVERAKDLLGLIHTNVCGPFKIMSRQGASYFLTFTDNFIPSGSLEDLEIIQEKDTHPSIDTSLNHEEDDLEIDEPQSDIVPIGRSTRTRHASDRMCLYIDAEEHELRDLGEPANYKAALLDPESKKWLNAMNVEMQSMKNNKVWVLLEFPPNGKTVHIRAIRILIAIAAYYDYEIWQMDVKTAFFNGYLNEEVYMEKPEGEAAYILGIKIYRDRSRRLIGLCQSAYIKKILKRYCMQNSKRGSIPMQEKLKLSKSEGASTPAELKRMQNVPYASVNPGDLYWTTVKNILKYLRNTKDMFLVYGDDLKRELRVSCYTDAGYLTDADDLKSQTGYVFVLNSGAVDWKSAKQSIFATSSAEAEITKGARHFRAKVHYLREVIEYGDVKLEKVHTYDNLADPFTKALAFPKHSEHTRNIRMLLASSLMSKKAGSVGSVQKNGSVGIVSTNILPRFFLKGRSIRQNKKKATDIQDPTTMVAADSRIVLSIEDKLNYLEQPIPPASVAPAGQHVAPEILAAHNAWIKGSKEIVGLMLMTMEPKI